MAVSDIFRGMGVAMITPFKKDGEINFQHLAEHTDRLISQGTGYLVVLGTTAETPTLSDKEKEEVLRCVMDACASRVPVLAGVGGNDTRALTESLKKPMLQGVQGILSVAPYYNKPTQEGIYQHFSAIATMSEYPVMLYNVPGRTSSNIAADTTLRLANDFPDKIVGIKEASGDFTQLMDILSDRPEGFLVVSGDDAITLPMISAGGDGVISVIGNAYPALMSTMVSAALDGSYNKSRELHYQLFPMIKAIFKEGNPGGVKASMEIQGWIENALRLPLIPVTHNLYEEIAMLHKELSRY
jgi:4-hydroxy-tetrahydrodipicolinate synthase